jgi:protein-S-isoprenylcysteine O-methyltransferase Ste14
MSRFACAFGFFPNKGALTRDKKESKTMNLLSVVYGIFAYVIFLPTFLYAVGFVGNLFVAKSIDAGATTALPEAIGVDLALLGLFAIQHSVMARPGFKRLWARIVPPAIERSTYVLLASLVLILLFWQWRPIPTPIWTVTDPRMVLLLQVIFWLGWFILLLSTFLLNHFELFGLRQVFASAAQQDLPPPEFRTPLFYRYVRHPLYLGFLISFWATPVMSAGHLLFCAATSGYILVGIWFEERDLIAVFGDRYRRYREQVGMLLPLRSGRARTR